MQHQYSYEYNSTSKVLYQMEDNKVVNSIFIPEEDIEKLRFLFWVEECEMEIKRSGNTFGQH